MSIVAFFVIWHFGSLLMDSVLFPSPVQFLVTFAKLLLDGTLIHESYVSLQRILSGFIIGSVIAIPLGLLMGSFRVMRLILDPYIRAPPFHSFDRDDHGGRHLLRGWERGRASSSSRG